MCGLSFLKYCFRDDREVEWGSSEVLCLWANTPIFLEEGESMCSW